MRWLGLLLALVFFTGATGAAYLASAQGWGLPGQLDQPVSVRQGSTSGTRGPTLIYFGSHRRHFGGGFRGGK